TVVLSHSHLPINTTLFPYTTLFRSEYTIRTAQQLQHRIIYCDTDSLHIEGEDIPKEIEHLIDPDKLGYWAFEGQYKKGKYLRQRSEEHTSELQSRFDIVCRLLLEQK